MLIKLAAVIWKVIPRWARVAASRSLQSKFTVSAGAIVTNAHGEVLLLDHVLRPMSGWGIPGGFMEKDEQAESALRRELREETGLELRDISVHRVRTFGRHVEIIFVAVGVGVAEVKSREITRLGWFAVEDMPPEMSLDVQFMIRGALRPGRDA